MRHAARAAVLVSAIALFVGAQATHSSDAPVQSAPTPYPARAENWPGKGAIRVFGWMQQNREFFWTERTSKQGAIVFAGDSLTGTWKGLGKAFPGTLVANRGIGGDVSRGLLFRFQEDVLDLHPKAIVMLIGINDLTARQPASLTLENVRAMLTLRNEQQPRVPVFLCTVPPSAHPKAPVDEQQRRLLNEGLRQLAHDTTLVTLVDLHAATTTSDGRPDPRYFHKDQLHLSAAGHERWKEVLEPALQRAGVL